MKRFKAQQNYIVFILILGIFLITGCGGGGGETGHWNGPSDTAAPMVTFVTPANASTGIAINRNLTATFSEPMDSGTVLALGTFTVKGPFGITVPGTVTYDVPSRTATFNPTVDLLNSTTYTAKISTAAKDVAGNALVSDFEWGFSTAVTPDIIRPVVVFTAPANGVTGVAINSMIVATFNEAMDPATMIGANISVTCPGPCTSPVGGSVTYAAGSFAMTFDPTLDLEASTVYTVTITGVTGVKDLAGNFMLANYSWSFTTADVLDTTGPRINSTNPVADAVDVSIYKKVSATFSEPMDPLTIITANFTLMEGLNSVGGTVEYDALNNIATFSPLVPLDPDTQYTALISTGATDLAGNPLESGLVPNPWDFTTIAVPPPFVGIDLGVASTFGIAATAGIVNVGATTVNGDVVLDPLAECNGVTVGSAGLIGACGGTPPIIIGTVISPLYPDAGVTSLAVKNALRQTYIDISPGSLGGATVITGPTLGALAGNPYVLYDNYFTAGVYKTTSGGMSITGDLTLDGLGDPNALFIFQSDSTLGMADGSAPPGVRSRILLINGAKASNVWWQVGSAATLGTYSEFQGNILSYSDLTLKTGATSCGRLFAGASTDGAFTFGANVVSVPGQPFLPPATYSPICQ